MSVKEATSIHEVLQRSTFGPEEIKQVEAAISGGQLTDVRAAAQELRSEIETGEGNKVKQTQAGVLFYLLAKYDLADQHLSKATGDGVGAYYYGLVLTDMGRFPEASKAFEQAAKHGFDPVQCLLSRAGSLRAAGDLTKADELLKQASTQGGATRSDYCYQMGCILSDKGDTYGAVEYFERAVDMNPNHSRALFWLAGENAQRGNDDEAIRLYERSLSKPPFFVAGLLNLGLLYEDAENYQAAAFCFRRVLELDPTHARAGLYLKDIDAAHDMYYDEDTLRNQARLKQLLEIPVTDFELSVRSRNCLQKMGIRNLGDLTRTTEQELLAGKNFGETSLQEIKEMMESKGLRLGQNVMKDRPRDYGYAQESLNPQQQALLNRPVADLNLSVRARKCMSRLGITTLGELIQRTPDELLESKNFGVTSLNEVRNKLTDLGMKLRND